jgi:hypothetical protein
MCRLRREHHDHDCGPGSADGTRPAGPAADDGRVGAAEEELARELAERARAGG